MSTNRNGRTRIEALAVRDVKCVRLVEISEVGDVLQVRGDTGQGKTTILEAIRAAFEGMDPSMIRNGADAAEIHLQLSDMKIDRVLRADGNDTEIVTGKDGKRVIKPKALLRAICDRNAFDPIAWVRLGGGEKLGQTERRREQRNQLLGALSMTITDDDIAEAVSELGDPYLNALASINLDGVDMKAHALTVCSEMQKACYEYRAIENARAVDAEKELQLTPAPTKAAPREDAATCQKLVEVAREKLYAAKSQSGRTDAVRKQIETLRESIQKGDGLPGLDDAKQQLYVADKVARTAADEVDRLVEQLLRARKEMAQTESLRQAAERVLRNVEMIEAKKVDLANAEHELKTSGAVVDLGPYERAVAACEDDLAKRVQQDKYDAASAKATAAREKAEVLTRLVELFRDDLPKRIVERAKLPVDGLTIDADQILIQGVPLHQLGTSEQMKVGVAIASALNPKAGFVLVDGAESMGSKDLRDLAEIASELDVQLIMTFVDADAEPRPGTVVMREGAMVTG